MSTVGQQQFSAGLIEPPMLYDLSKKEKIKKKHNNQPPSDGTASPLTHSQGKKGKVVAIDAAIISTA